MKTNRNLWTALAAGALLCLGAPASGQEVDLGAQRSESQYVQQVPGEKIDHRGIIINPTPHDCRLDPTQRIDISGGIVLKDKQNKFSDDLAFIAAAPKRAPAAATLSIDFGAKAAAKLGVKAVSGAYRMEIGKKGIAITGYDERGAFYGIQTLRQMVESPAFADGKLPYAEIADYPDLPIRGVVEGFYGNPWSHQVRLSLIEFYGKFKMNSYIYGPKDDPYHSCPNWRLPYPEKEAANIRELVEACNRNRVDFVWAIHPGQDIQWNEEDYGNLVRKFELMYGLGVRSFAIFFDDISGEGTNPARQTELLNRLDRDFVRPKGDVASLIVCPTDYTKLWANPTPQGSLCVYGKTLDPSIKVFWTGDAVCSDLTRETLEWVNSRIGRPAFYWWNFPVTDYARHIIMQGPTYGLDTSLSADEVCGLVSNPMEHGEASKLALYGVADYSWNIAGYNPIDNWERGIDELAPEAREAYRTFAIHSCDTETGYRRAESWETETFAIDDCTDARFEALMNEFEKIERVPGQMEQHCTNKALLAELRPWLAEFGKLGTRGKKTLETLKCYRTGDDARFWAAYADNLMSDEERAAYEAHKSGTMKLQPFYERAMDDMIYGFFTRLTGEIPATYRGIGSFRNIGTTLSKLMFDNDPETYYTSATSQQEGSWIGADLGRIRQVSEVTVLQGRNSVDDVDYFDHAVLECSKDGKEWSPLADDLRGQYEIRWSGEPVATRYVRLRRLESDRKNWASVRSFEVNPVRAEKLPFELRAADVQQALFAFDSNPGTSYVNKGLLAFGVPEGTKGYTLLLKLRNAPAAIRQLTADGQPLAAKAIDTPFVRIALEEGAASIELDGEVEVFEIIPE